MLPKFDELRKELKTKREGLNWSQRKLANQAGVSKALVGKMERGHNIPNYKNIKKIYDALRREEDEDKKKAKDFVNKNIVSVSPDDSIGKASRLMKEKDFSQLPVKDEEGVYMGLITSNEVMDENKEKKVKTLKSDYIQKISHETGKEAIVGLLKDDKHAVLVEKDEKVIGIITTADLL